MPDLLGRFRRWWGGERRRVPRNRDGDRTNIVNRHYAIATKLAKRYGTTPEALLLDYRRADRILGGHR